MFSGDLEVDREMAVVQMGGTMPHKGSQSVRLSTSPRSSFASLSRRTLAASTLALSLLAGMQQLSAQSVATPPVGAVTVTVPGNLAYTFFAPPFTREAVYQGTVGSVSGAGLVVNLNSASLQPAQLGTIVIGAETLPQYFVEVLDGSDVGAHLPISANTATSVTLSEDVSSFVSAGTKVRIVPYHTLSSLFPNGGGLNGGLSSGSADNVLLFSPATGARTFFYRSSASEWREGSVNNNLRPILNNQAIYVQRKQTSAASVTLTGTVKSGSTAIDVSEGFNLVPNPYPVPIPLATSNLYTGNVATGVKAALSSASADNVTIYASDGTSNTYFYRSGSGAGWRDGNGPVTGIMIPANGALLINRRAGSGPFSWVIAQPWTQPSS